MDPFVEDVLTFVRSETFGPILKKILEYEDKVVAEGGWHKSDTYNGRPLGWEWYEVNVWSGHLMKLASAGIVSVVYKSSKHTAYRLTDPELVRRALSGEIPQGENQEEPLDEGAWFEAFKDLFNPIVGYEDVKHLFFRALTAPKPVHILLEGPPSSAKTLFLMEVGRLPRAYFALGGSTSKAGLVDVLLLYRPRYLLLDEVETIDNVRDYAALLHLMENEEVIETKYRRRNRVPLRTWVFAAGNDVSKLSPALLSRFGGKQGVVRFREYTAQEFVEVSMKLLTMREGVPEVFARKVAEAALDLGSRDIRLAIRLARLASDEEGLTKVVETMRRRR